jgi:hypothetical protein
MLDTDNGRRVVATPAPARKDQVSAEATDARPGMGAERMTMTHRRQAGYQPRHRSTRRAATEEWLATNTWDEPVPAWDDELTDAGQWADQEPLADQLVQADQLPLPDEFGPADQGEPELHDHLSSDQLRHVLEGCALDDVARIVRPLVQIIAHPSHTATTLASAWGEFCKSTRDAYALHVGACRWSDFFRREELGFYPAEDAVELKLREADDAWQLLTTGVLAARNGSPPPLAG